jgi:hypothetical protein
MTARVPARPQQGLTAEEAASRIEVLKKLLNARLDNKSARNEGNAQCLRRILKFADLSATSHLTLPQWRDSFERLGAQLSQAVRAAGEPRAGARACARGRVRGGSARSPRAKRLSAWLPHQHGCLSARLPISCPAHALPPHTRRGC